jgi:hypothetical protein
MAIAGLGDAAQRVDESNEQTAGHEAQLDETDEEMIETGNSARDLDREYAQQQRRAQMQRQQHEQQSRTGHGGFKNFYVGRPELTGTPSYDGNWLQHSRPAVERGIGPGWDSGLADKLAARGQRKNAERQRAELAPTIEAADAAEARQADPNRHQERRQATLQPAIDAVAARYGPRNTAGARPPGSQFAAPVGAPPAWPGTATSSKPAKKAPAKGRGSKRSK